MIKKKKRQKLEKKGTRIGGTKKMVGLNPNTSSTYFKKKLN